MNNCVAIISDIHANLPALQAVIAHIENQGISERVCLGDVVGYGAQPMECIDLVRASGFQTILGNHDASVAADILPEGFSDLTAQSILWTREALDAEHRAWLRSLPLTLCAGDFEAVHASLHHPLEWNYILGADAAALHFKHQRKEICFIGHSHIPAMYMEGQECALDLTSLESLRKGRKQVVNVGSVGQPRDKNPDACYLIYRRAQADVWWRRVPYDIEAAQRAIAAAGLPGKHAHRLSLGK